MVCCGGSDRKTLLVVGGSFSGLFVARVMKKKFWVTVVDAKEFFEYTPGVLRAFVKPAHFDSLSFTLQPVLERSMGVKFLWGEVKSLDAHKKQAVVKPMFTNTGDDIIAFDYAMICAGCNFGAFEPHGDSLWFPCIHEHARKECKWGHIDERFIEGRRRHILEVYQTLREMDAANAKILVVGAGFIGVEWVTELNHYFPNLDLTIVDVLKKCLGPLPESAAEYCSDYMNSVGIHEFYGVGFEPGKLMPDSQEWWDGIGLPDRSEVTVYGCTGVKASNFFMPPETLSKRGPGGGGWIHMNWFLQVTEQSGKIWGDGSVFAVGDCNYGCIEKSPEGIEKAKGEAAEKTAKLQTKWKADVAKWQPKYDAYERANQSKADWDNLKAEFLKSKPAEPAPVNMDPFELPPVPKISYPGEEQALHACKNIMKLAKGKSKLNKTWWPWGAGMFATSLGPHDACFVLAANDKKGSGYMVNWWIFAALQKEIIETSKIDECRNAPLGKLIWYFVHHTPCNCWGKGPFIP